MSLVDWPKLWQEEFTRSYLFESCIVKGRTHSLVARQKVGKSLFALWIATQVSADPDKLVIYMDNEMGLSDLKERLTSFGLEGRVFDNLKYYIWPDLQPLEESEGASQLEALIRENLLESGCKHPVVIIDTVSRVTTGEENSADTFRRLYQNTGLMLKRLGATVIRLDHQGKRAGKGARGSSGKGDDVDVAWQLSKKGTTFELDHKGVCRMSGVEQRHVFDLINLEGCLVYRSVGDPVVESTMAELRTFVGPDTTIDQAQEYLRSLSRGRKRATVVKAVQLLKSEIASALD